MPDILDCGDGTRLKPLQASKPADGSYDIGCAVPYGFQRLWHRHSSMSVILVRHLAGKKIHGTTTYHSSRSHMRGVPWGMHRNRITLRLFGHSRLRRIPYRHIRGEYGRLLRIRGAFGMAGRNPQNRGTREGICEPWMWHGHVWRIVHHVHSRPRGIHYAA